MRENGRFYSTKVNMKIAVIGAGAIGNLVAGYLKNNNQDVSLIGRADAVKAIAKNGLEISGVRGLFKVGVSISERLTAKPDLAILAVKTQDLDASIKDNFDLLGDSFIVLTQNGVRAEEEAASYIPKKNIISSIVMFGATYLEPGKVAHNFEGNWIIGKVKGGISDERLSEVSLVLDKAFPTVISQQIQGMKYLKVFVNANNCIPAILGVSMQEAFSDLEISRISIAIWREGLKIISAAGITLESLPGFPAENIVKFTSMPAVDAAKVFSGIMSNLSKIPLYGSILQSIKRQRVSEIDYINGEFVSLAGKNSLRAPLNEKLSAMVHEVEKKRRFFNKDEFLCVVKPFVD